MKAIRIHQFDSTAEVLQYEELPISEPESQGVFGQGCGVNVNPSAGLDDRLLRFLQIDQTSPRLIRVRRGGIFFYDLS